MGSSPRVSAWLIVALGALTHCEAQLEACEEKAPLLEGGGVLAARADATKYWAA